MAFQRKENTGAIFPNDKKSDNAPDFSGTINVDGKDYRIALWENFKENDNGHEVFSHFGAIISEPQSQSQGSSSGSRSSGSRRTYSKPSRR